jgi:hypothetical protein
MGEKLQRSGKTGKTIPRRINLKANIKDIGFYL